MALFGRKKPMPVEEEPVVEEPRLPEAPPVNAAGLRSARDHREYLLSLVEPLRPFGMSLLEAWDQVMCEDIDSMINVPPNSTSKVEGYAVRATDLVDSEGNLVESLDLVDQTGERLERGAAVAVRVSDVLPRGATAVLPSSFATLSEGKLALVDTVAEGDYVRAAGEHLAIGTRLLSQGEVLNDRAIGMLAGAGIDKVLVRPRPRIVVLSSGEDMVDPGEELRHGQTTDSNSFMIAAAARAAGATVFRVAIHSNDRDHLKQVVSDQLIRADLLVSASGGRLGDYEAMAAAMADLGLTDSVDVAMSPGRTQTFGLIGEEQVPMVMLPGNPVSAYVSFHAFVWPLIRRLAGADENRRPVRAITSTTLRSTRGQLHLLRADLRSSSSVRTVERVQDPHALTELVRSNALIVLDEETEMIAAGQAVMCWQLDED